jgi:hypothetical protein
MAKKHGGVALTAFNVDVKPMSTNGSDVNCDIINAPPGIMTDNAMFLQLNTPYDITFNLVAGPGGAYTFDPAKPFTNQAKRCPPPLPAGSVHAPCSLTGKSANSITVHVAPLPSRTVTNYRLNFTGNFSSDPIIVVN